MPELFDTHVNLHGEIYDDDRSDVIMRARDAGVAYLLSICDKPTSIETIATLTVETPNMWRTVGCHPHYAKDFQDLSSQWLVEQAEDPLVVGIGEAGMDMHYGYSDLEDQKRVFQAQIEAAQDTGLPLVVHTREADDVTGEMLESAYKAKPFSILMHCYTSGEALAHRMMDIGAYFSVSGIVTFKNAHDVRYIAKQYPQDRVILETDCPYLAPVPKRGRRNEPAYLEHVCRYYADLMDVSFDTMVERTTSNALRLFSRIKPS